MKAIEILHPSFAVWCGVLAAALVVIAGLVVTSPGVHGHLARLGKCAIAGVIAATALVVYVDSKHHELTAVGVTFVSPPKRQFWGYGAEVLDPDGYMNHLWDEATMAKAMREVT